jgi:uncharacterized protein DUF1918
MLTVAAIRRTSPHDLREARRKMLKAKKGDRLVVDERRIGVITGVRHPDGTPPYEVRWLDSGHEALVFPGPGAHIETAVSTDRGD